MPDTVRTLAALQGLLADNVAGDISAQDVRDMLVSVNTPEWMSYLAQRLPDETAHADDDFFETDSSADYTELDITGTTIWSIGRGVLSSVFAGQASTDLGAYLKAITSASAPMTFETALTVYSTTSGLIGTGLLLTDGVVAGSNVLGLHLFSAAAAENGTIEAWGGTLTDMFTAGSKGVLSANTFGLAGSQVTIYLRIIWKSANTWQLSMSWDGNAWFNQGIADAAFTMTPTHFGLGVTTRSDAEDFAATVHYFRVYGADLSV